MKKICLLACSNLDRIDLHLPHCEIQYLSIKIHIPSLMSKLTIVVFFVFYATFCFLNNYSIDFTLFEEIRDS